MDMHPQAATATPAAGRWPQAVRGFLCQNVAVGCAFGGFGLTVLPVQAEFGVSRGMATLGLSLAVLAMGLVSPAVAQLIGRIGLRRTMLLGTILSGLGYVALALAPSIYLMLAAYALLIGIGIGMFGPFPSSVLASNWFQPSPGPAIGFVNTPLFVALLPIAGLSLISRHGLPAFFLALAGLHMVLLPFVLGVRDAPAAMAAAGADAHHAPPVPARAILSRPLFWAMTVGAGALNAAGITGVSHIVAFALERGISATQAALLISVMGGASIIGSLVVGMICAAIGAARTLALTGAGLALSWLVLLSTDSLPLMVPATLVIGACGAGVFPSVNVLSGQVFGTAALARVVGLFGLFTLPLTFCLPPAAGVLHDAARSYDPVAAVLVAVCGAVMLLFYTTARIIARREQLRAAGATLG